MYLNYHYTTYKKNTHTSTFRYLLIRYIAQTPYIFDMNSLLYFRYFGFNLKYSDSKKKRKCPNNGLYFDSVKLKTLIRKKKKI